jgi:glycosyltransferase involved in cell wall biosynthesis
VNHTAPSHPLPSIPLVSVVTVVRNAVTAIESTIQSVLSQDYPAVEYVVIDGNSSDGTLAVIERFRERLAILRSEPDAGIYDAMNKGAALATGEWVIFMNAGDAFHSPRVLSAIREQLASSADVICGATEKVHSDDIEMRRYTVAPGRLANLWRWMPASHQATLVRRELQQRYRFDVSYRWCADQDLLLRLYNDGKTFALTNETLCVFDCAGGMARDPMLYVRERWRLSKGMASLTSRLFQFGGEWFHCTVWGRAVAVIRPLMSPALRRTLRRIRGTAGDRASLETAANKQNSLRRTTAINPSTRL